MAKINREEYESEETEVRDIEWLREEIWKQDIVMDKGYIYTDDLMSIISEVDEPETLSPGWISRNVEYAYYKTPDGEWSSATAVINPSKLKKLLVPKQEEITDEQIARKVDRAYKDGYEKGKEHATEKERETETVASVFLNFLIASAKLKLALGMEVEELEE